jgi:hypothetical protein
VEGLKISVQQEIQCKSVIMEGLKICSAGMKVKEDVRGKVEEVPSRVVCLKRV